MGQKDSASDASKTPAPNLEALYYDSEVVHEVIISGIVFKLKEMSGKEYTGIIDRCSSGTGKLDRQKYIETLIKKAVIWPDPEKINFAKLKASAQTMLCKKIEDILGMTELVQKNLREM